MPEKKKRASRPRHPKGHPKAGQLMSNADVDILRRSQAAKAEETASASLHILTQTRAERLPEDALRGTPGVSVGQEPFDKNIDRRAELNHDQVTDAQLFEDTDPFAVHAKQHGTPGFRPRFLSNIVSSRRGDRGWVRRGTKVAGMEFAEMPEESAQRRTALIRAKTEEDFAAMQERADEQINKVVKDSKLEGGALPRGTQVVDSRDPSRAATVGVEIRRGL